LWRFQLRVDRHHGGTVKVTMLPSIHRVEARLPLVWRPDRWGSNA
jgi:hypothetical protein